MKTKKLLSIMFLFSLIVSFAFVAPNINAMQIPEGAVIKTEHNPDVYIVKYKNGKQFKRLVLNPQVFESYGHLRWEDILIVSQSEMNSFTESTLVRSDGESNVYKLVANGDLGDKALVETSYTYDPDSVYTINNVDSGNYVLKKLEELAGIIDELQKQIDDIKTEISTPKVDFCNNIEGDQTYIPVGMYRNNGNCFTEVVTSEPEPAPKVDFCNNIEGEQTCIPAGMYRDNGNCFVEIVVPEPEPTPVPTSIIVKNSGKDTNGRMTFSITNNGPDIVRIKRKFEFVQFTPIGISKIVNNQTGDEYIGSLGEYSYKAGSNVDTVYYSTYNCVGLKSIGTYGIYHSSPVDPCKRKPANSYIDDSLLAINEIGPNETIFLTYGDYTNYTVNYNQGILNPAQQALKYTSGNIIEVSTGNDVIFQDLNL